MTYNEAQQIKKAIALLSESGSNTKLLAQNILVGMLTEQPKQEYRYIPEGITLYDNIGIGEVIVKKFKNDDTKDINAGALIPIKQKRRK